MNAKKTRGVCALALILSMSLTAFSPVMAVTTDGENITTSLVRDEGSGANPIIKVKWEMNTDKDSGDAYMGTDDSVVAGAQFNPSGVYQQDKTIAVCAIVTDPDGVSDIDAVYADTFYPTGIYLGDNHESDRQGCGQLMNEFTLSPLTKAEGIELFCNKIRNNNNNLPVFDPSGLYDYDDICATDGELMKETAYVYCGERTLSYEDPSGDYRTLVMAQDKSGKDRTLENYFTYLELTAFETDFSYINYGNVKLNTHKIINGDLTWDGMDQGKASVRNVGNARLIMKVYQDDMELGTTDGKYNVQYDARVGSDATFKYYSPYSLASLNNPLDLSETNEMDFSINIFKFPPEHSYDYTGDMTLSAVRTDHLICE